jgi:hypothetical protein
MEISRFKRKFFSLIVLVLIIAFPLSTFAGVFGVGAYLSSEPDADKTTVANMMSDLGMSITRMTINYSDNIDWSPYDTAVELTRSRNIENLILLHYEGSLPSSGDYCNFVGQVASRYSGKTAGYEILNEADNYLSGSNYAPYLSCSYDAIKANDSGAKVIASGLTARTEATNFWQGIVNAGAWDKLDAIGLHPYREKAPEVVDFNIGDFVTSINIAANFINGHGGGKKIWLTEFGTKNSVGDANQANYTARSFIMARSVSEVEKIISYRFRDNGEGYGIVNSNLSHRSLWDRYKDVLNQLDYAGTAERIYVFDKSTIDSFDLTSGYKTDLSSNASLNLSTTSGYSGNGLKMAYNFNSSNGYVVANKQKSIDGQPVGIGIWAKGPNTSSILKLRIVDNNNETFQFDLGKVTGDWNFYKFDFAHDVAKVSWGGNGNIDYPIKFDSVVYDSQGGVSSGSLYVDEAVSINGSADMYAYKLGSKLAYWKVSGSSSNSVCGKTLNFTEEPQVTSVSSCSVWDTGSTQSAPVAQSAPVVQSAPSAPMSNVKTTTPAPSAPSVYSADNTQVAPNNWTATIGDNIELDLKVRDSEGNEMAGDKMPAQGWELITKEGTFETIQAPIKDNNFKAIIKSSIPQKIVVGVKYNGAELARLTTIYINPKMTELKDILPEKIFTVKKDDSIVLTAKPNDALGIHLDGMPESTKVIAKISSDPTYFWLSNNKEANRYEGVIIMPSEAGKHEIEIYSENDKGEMAVFAKGDITIKNDAIASVTSAPKRVIWPYIIAGVAGLVAIIFIIILLIPKLRIKLFNIFKHNKNTPVMHKLRYIGNTSKIKFGGINEKKTTTSSSLLVL